MARTQSLGALIGMTVFILLFIVTLALSILFYVNWQENVQKIAEMEQNEARLVHPNTTTGNEYLSRIDAASGADNATPVIDQLIAQRRRFLRLIEIDNAAELMGSTSSAEGAVDDVDVIKRLVYAKYSDAIQPLESLYEANGFDRVPDENDAMPTVIKNLANMIREVDDKNKLLVANEERMKKELADVNRKMTAVQAAMTTEIENYKSDLAAMETRVKQAIQENTDRVKDHESDVAQKNEAYQQEIQNLVNDIALKEEEIRGLGLKIASLNSKLQSIPRIKPTSLYEPDGQILSSNTQTRTVHINLGNSDKVMPGLTFEVFDKERGVQVDEDNERLNRGKATIEVIRVNENNSLCRVIYQRYGSTIQPTDLVANIAYDKSKKYRFVVYGDFDLNNDGITQPFEKVRMKDLITRYGGIILDEPEYDEDSEQFNIDVAADYFVMGVRPEPPTEEEIEGGLDNVEDERIVQEKQRKVEMYENLRDAALKYSIPVLNQNRALALMGVYQN